MIYTGAHSEKVVDDIIAFVNNIRPRNNRVVFADAYLQFLSETRKLKVQYENVAVRFSPNSLLRSLYEHLKDNMMITADTYLNLTIRDADEFCDDSTQFRLKRKATTYDITDLKPVIASIIQRICNNNNTLTWCNNKYTYLIGRFIFIFENKKYFFNIFIDIDNNNNILIHESDKKIKLVFSLSTPTEVHIDTYYANEMGGPNLDVLRRMLHQFTKVHITLDTKIRTDDYQDIPYGLWPFVEYSTSQFYEPLNINELNPQIYGLYRKLLQIGKLHKKFSGITISQYNTKNLVNAEPFTTIIREAYRNTKKFDLDKVICKYYGLHSISIAIHTADI
jgi:hypothetical protein